MGEILSIASFVGTRLGGILAVVTVAAAFFLWAVGPFKLGSAERRADWDWARPPKT